MSPRLARLVVRVPRELRKQLAGIADRLFMETAYDYSYSAIIRGLLAIGIVTVTAAPEVAPLFAGTRIARGRKKVERDP